MVKGDDDQPIELVENDSKFVADLSGGQKTGWFYDQRDNRRFMAGFAKDANVLDVYSYSGGFGVLAAARGAKSVTCVDRSQPALNAAKAAAALNGVDKVVSFEKSEVFDALEKRSGKNFEVVICDPPAFVKSRKDLKTGAQGYRKLVRLAAPLVTRAASSSSPPARTWSMRRCSRAGAPRLRAAGRSGRILRSSGAALDHPCIRDCRRRRISRR